MTLSHVISIAMLAMPIFAALPVVPAKDQSAFLKSSDAKLKANKKIAYDFYRIVLQGRQLDQADKYMKEDYIQHNPNAETGIQGFKDYFSKLGPSKTGVPATLPGLVAIQAEGDYVNLTFVREYPDPANPGQTYTTTWFDMFRIENGKIAEHWDCATKAAPAAKK